MEESRTRNTIKNVKTGVVMQVINKLMIFVVRTVFIRMLNSEYLGVNGLFTNILTVLSFAELGIGTAIIFNMYKPVALDDREKIKSLMQLYKKAYIIIGIVVFILGIILIPFLNFIVKDIPNIKENIVLIYILFLINTSSSYFFTYKKSIISAYQKESIINRIDSVFYLLKSIIEIIILCVFKNYILYLVTQIVVTILENIYIAQKANKMFPYLKDKNIKGLTKYEKETIFQNVKSLIVYKFGSVVMYGTDNILISSLINVSSVGLCSNYNMVINAIKNIMNTVLNGITASIGNLNAIADKEKKESVFYQITFLNFWIYSFCAICFMILLNPFIKIWLGEEFTLSLSIPISLAISFWIEGLRMPAYTYRVTLGLFEKGKSTPYIGAITNIILSIILCNKMGLVGIFIATSISQLISYSWIDPFLIHKNEFKTSFRKYIIKYCKYVFTFIFIYLISMYITKNIVISNIFDFILEAGILVTIINICILLVSFRTKEFKEIKNKFFYLIKNKRKNV